MLEVDIFLPAIAPLVFEADTPLPPIKMNVRFSPPSLARALYCRNAMVLTEVVMYGVADLTLSKRHASSWARYLAYR